MAVVVVVVVLKVPLVLVAKGGKGGNPWGPMTGCWRWSLPIDMDATRLLLLVGFRSEDLGVVDDPEGPDKIHSLPRLSLMLLSVNVVWSLITGSVSSLDLDPLSSSSVSRGVGG